MSRPHVAIAPPPAWVEANVDRPTIAEASGAQISDWQALRSPRDDAAIVAGCVATPIPGWVEDMRPAVEARTVALAGAVTAKIVGAPADVRADEHGALALRLAADLGGPTIGRARTFVGFDPSTVFTCFATCARRPGGLADDARGPVECERNAVGASLDGSGAPPPPGLALGAATWAVHHPRPVVLMAGGLVIVLGCLAVVLRRRPRSRPHTPTSLC